MKSEQMDTAIFFAYCHDLNHRLIGSVKRWCSSRFLPDPLLASDQFQESWISACFRPSSPLDLLDERQIWQANLLTGQSPGQQLVILQGTKKWPFDFTLHGNQINYDASIKHAFIIIHRQPIGILNMFSLLLENTG